MSFETFQSNPAQPYLSKRYTLAEEIFSSITHGIGALLSVAALVILVAYASIHGDAWRIVSFSIYGFTLFFLYLSSTLYHSIFHEKTKRVLRIFDHSSIFLLIAGSYTPITLVSMRGVWGWILFSMVWLIAIIGIILKSISLDKMKRISIFLYIFMGWLIIIALKPMLTMIPPGLFTWLLMGGIIYTLGVIFYAWKKIPFNHGIWHLFVLGGSTTHFLGILFYLAM
ncbi:MAG: PAQR family membrane homeostasis protein TrhA [Peptococcaceae bacterium]